MKRVTFIIVPVVLIMFGLIPASPAVSEAAESLHFAFFNPDNEAKDPVTAVSAMKPFCDFMSEDIGQEIIIHYMLKKKDLENLISNTKISMALLSPLYVIENIDRLKLEPFAMPFVGDDINYRLILVVQRKSNWSSLADLKGKSLAYTALGDENIDFLNKLVFNNEIDVVTYFSKFMEVTSPSSAIMSVLYGQAEAACVTSGLFETMKELNPQVNRELTGVYLSPKILRSPMCFLGDTISPALKEKFKSILLSMHNTPLGEQTLMPFKVEGFKTIDSVPFVQMKESLLTASLTTPPAPSTPRDKVPVERISEITQPAGGTLTIAKIKHSHDVARNVAVITASITPVTEVKEADLIYQLQGQQRLTVSMTKQSSAAFSGDVPLPAPAATGEEKEIVYEVKSGDSLGKISKTYYGELKKWIQIATYNDLKNPNMIFVGQKLRIKLGGEFENIPMTVWIKATSNAGDVVLSPDQQILLTR